MRLYFLRTYPHDGFLCPDNRWPDLRALAEAREGAQRTLWEEAHGAGIGSPI